MRYLAIVLVLGCGKVNSSNPDAIHFEGPKLTITRSGGGTGTVTSQGGDIACGDQCTVSVASGTVVVLTASADASTSTFAGWNGGGCSGTGDCSVTVTADTTVDASFALGGLSVAKTGSGNGTIVSSPAGIDCGNTCGAAFPAGTMVTLTATGDTDSTFMGWGGACSGTGTCSVTAGGVQNVTAMFACGGSKMFAFTGAVQTFNVPTCATSITVDASGAQGGHGGTGAGGMGARIQGTFAKASLTSTMLNVLVGGTGGSVDNGNGGGGGGSFVYVAATDATPLVAAAGGGGFSSNSNCTAGGGSSTQTPTSGTNGSGNAAGGSAGGGGAGGTQAGTPSIPGTGGGGAGWIGNGAAGTVAAQGGGGMAPRNGGAGGLLATGGANGGFGGGGASAGTSGASGGGGGYNGGGGGNSWNNSYWGCGGGGGSYNAGTSPTNTANVRAGDGAVTISWQ